MTEPGALVTTTGLVLAFVVVFVWGVAAGMVALHYFDRWLTRRALRRAREWDRAHGL